MVFGRIAYLIVKFHPACVPNEVSIVTKSYYLNVGQLINNISYQANSTRKMTRILVFMSFMYVFLNLPYLILWLIFSTSTIAVPPSFSGNIAVGISSTTYKTSALTASAAPAPTIIQ